MKLFWQTLFGLALCGVCCNCEMAAAQADAPSNVQAPWQPTPPEGHVRLARLPAIYPPGMPGSGAFADWHRSDVKLAPDYLNDNSWGSGRATPLPPWRLLPASPSGWSFTGLINLGGTANPEQPASRFNGPLLFNDRDDVQLNQFYLITQRAPQAPCQGFDWGTRVDLLLGTDYVFVQSLGWETQPDGDNALNGVTAGAGNPNLCGLAIPQAFVDLAYNRFSVRLGHFYTIVGYEGVAASSNFFYSHTYALRYGEPLTHTGGLFRWAGDAVTVQAGVVNGWDKTDGVQDAATFLGGITYANARSSLGLAVITGEEQGIAATGQRSMYSLVWQTKMNDRLAYVLQHDFAIQRNALGAGDDARWYGVSQYLFLTMSTAWKLGVRHEWFRDGDGTRLSGMYVRNGGLGLPPAGFAGTYSNATLGANWTPNANLSVRPEIRWDWSHDTGLAPFADFTSDSQLTLALDAVYIF